MGTFGGACGRFFCRARYPLLFTGRACGRLGGALPCTKTLQTLRGNAVVRRPNSLGLEDRAVDHDEIYATAIN